ncbi:class I SAM-dependent methyltransferase [Bosea sp. 2YAB26]|uniref:class I SAM-dependent methyltransferase n=1 Tax=Bosea sp. 2YAB26 TaxID=3237478 RepID=UPI003F8F827B
MTNVFEQIYQLNTWGNSDSRSGDGSDAPSTARIRAALDKILAEFEIKSMLDIPVGDFNWMKLVNLDGVEYIGADIVKTVVERNNDLYRRDGISFAHLDACDGPIPQVDLICCRDMLVHLPFDACQAALQNFVRSGSRYLLTTTFTSRDPNRDIVAGQWRPINLQRPPFRFPRPIRYAVEDCREWNGLWADKCLGLWRLDDLKDAIARSHPGASLL